MPTYTIEVTLEELQAADKTFGIARSNLQRKAADLSTVHGQTAAADLVPITSFSSKVLSALTAVG